MSTVSVPVSELIGPTLDWAVAKCEGEPLQKGTGRTWQYWTNKVGFGELGIYNPSTNWSQGGPIIEREGISLRKESDTVPWWVASKVSARHGYGNASPLIAAMRCYVASKLGDTVEIPKELL